MDDPKTLKRQRDGQEETLEESQIKKQKSYEIILSILDQDDDVSTQDLSSLISTLEQEISSCSSESSPKIHPSMVEYTHLLEASDDELGIPNNNNENRAEVVEEEIDGGGLLLGAMDGCDELFWEIEDEAANYYALMQSQLFL